MSTDVATPATSTTAASSVAPRIIVKPSLKATQSKTPYSVALDNMIAEFCQSYVSEEMTPEQKQATLAELNETTSNIRGLCDQYLRPLCNDKPQTGGAAVAAAAPVQVAAATAAPAKPLSDWQIFLKYAKELVPGHAESTDKMGLAKAHYANMSEQECADLRARYELANPTAPTAATVAAAAQSGGTAAAKGKRQTGFTMFAKDWYAAFKAANPDASGLQSSLCSAAWKELPEPEKEQWKALAKQ